MVFQQPAILQPVLDFLSEHVPAPLYYLLVRLLSHSLAALTAISALCASLISTHPSDWNAQALLPPIITILAAYLALASLYRTTSWLIRLIFWFVKWGTLFGIFMAGVGYFMGNAGNGVGIQAALPVVGGYLSNFLEDNRGAPRTRQTKSRQTKPKSRRPKAWDSFDKHQEWQYRENEGRNENDQMQQVIDMVTGTVGQLLAGNWWGSAESISKETSGSDKSKKSSKPKGQRTGRSRSR